MFGQFQFPLRIFASSNLPADRQGRQPRNGGPALINPRPDYLVKKSLVQADSR